jgi:hypothetical protein
MTSIDTFEDADPESTTSVLNEASEASALNETIGISTEIGQPEETAQTYYDSAMSYLEDTLAYWLHG